MYQEKYSLLNDVTRWRSCPEVMRGFVPSIRIWSPRRHERSVVLSGACGWRSFDWPERL